VHKHEIIQTGTVNYILQNAQGHLIADSNRNQYLGIHLVQSETTDLILTYELIITNCNRHHTYIWTYIQPEESMKL